MLYLKTLLKILHKEDLGQLGDIFNHEIQTPILRVLVKHLQKISPRLGS